MKLMMANKEEKIAEYEIFIQAFEKEESLWNVVNPIYKDRNQKRKALERLSTQFKLSGK